MTRTDANRFLSRLRAGDATASEAVISHALRLTGDLQDEPEVVTLPLVPMAIESYLNCSTRVMKESA